MLEKVLIKGMLKLYTNILHFLLGFRFAYTILLHTFFFPDKVALRHSQS